MCRFTSNPWRDKPLCFSQISAPFIAVPLGGAAITTGTFRFTHASNRIRNEQGLRLTQLKTIQQRFALTFLHREQKGKILALATTTCTNAAVAILRAKLIHFNNTQELVQKSVLEYSVYVQHATCLFH